MLSSCSFDVVLSVTKLGIYAERAGETAAKLEGMKEFLPICAKIEKFLPNSRNSIHFLEFFTVTLSI